jgi:hypothetical protein
VHREILSLKIAPLDSALFPSESLNSLYLPASLRPLIESIANLTAVDADIFQIPIAEIAQSDKVRLALTVCDHGGDRTVDETAGAHQKNSDSSADRWRGVAWRGVGLNIVMDFPSRKGLRSALRHFCWDQHARCHVPGLSEKSDLFSKCP